MDTKEGNKHKNSQGGLQRRGTVVAGVLPVNENSPGTPEGGAGGGGKEERDGGRVVVDKNPSFAAGPLPHLLLQ